MAKKTALVICPGRGTYNKQELGYFFRYHSDDSSLLSEFDAQRKALGQQTLSSLDQAERYSIALHTRGDNASALIYACALADFEKIDRDKFEILAVTGNSMGWYIALACAGALNNLGGFDVINTMGQLMQDALIGGQLLYPFVDENWQEIPGKKQSLLALTEQIPNLSVSIYLGGMIVFAGDAQALVEAEKRLQPTMDRYPMRLHNHAAFHSPLQAPVSNRGQQALSTDLFKRPEIPLIDGRGHIWYPSSADTSALYNYTFGHQVIKPYDFSAAIRNGLHEFAPDALIILGPGNTLGGTVGQCLIQNQWQQILDKISFMNRQEQDPFVLAMGLEKQREMVLGY